MEHQDLGIETPTAAIKAGAGEVHLLLFPWLAFGHIGPFAELARKLLAIGGFRISFLSAAANADRIAAMLPRTTDLSVVSFSLPPVDGLPAGVGSTADVDAHGAELMKMALDSSQSQIDEILRRLHPDIIVFDFATQWIPTLAKTLGIKTLIFLTLAPFSLAFLGRPDYIISKDEVPSVDDMARPPVGFPSPVLTCTVPQFQAETFVYAYKRYCGMPSVYGRSLAAINGSDGIVLRGIREIEGEYVSYFESQHNNKKVHLAGPLLPELQIGELDGNWSNWLDRFGDGEVVFSSFGSETILSVEAIRELLLGLEMSGSPFIVALKSSDGKEPNGVVPPGFADRVKGRGLVHFGWVPQQLILRHRTVGGFLSHGGLSSIYEGLLSDCRLILLPMFCDQFLNAALFADELGVATNVERKDDRSGFFERGAVSAAVRAAMEEDEGSSMASGRRKLREFLKDATVQERYTKELATSLKQLIE